MFTRIGVTAAFIAALSLLPAPAFSASACGTHDTITAALGHQYKESRRAAGLSQETYLFEFFASDKGTWTVIATNSKGVSCIVVAGDGWEMEKTIAGIESSARQ